MFVSEISFWGAVLVACLVLVASIALAFIDRQMLRRMMAADGLLQNDDMKIEK